MRTSITAILILGTLALVTGCSVEDQSSIVELPGKNWKSEQYRKIQNVYNDSENYAIAEIEEKKGEYKVCFSLGDDKPMTFLLSGDSTNRAFPSKVKYPGSSEILEVREVYLMAGEKYVAYACRPW
jgi:hypothetical protein